MAKYRVQTQFGFNGYFIVEADSITEAKRSIMQDCGLVMGGGIHSNLPDEDINWNFPIHPDMEIQSVKKIQNKIK